MPLPEYPVLFFKPVTSLGGPLDTIPVPPIAQEAEGVDYECELVVVIGREARDVPASAALELRAGLRRRQRRLAPGVAAEEGGQPVESRKGLRRLGAVRAGHRVGGPR